ncbi:hypothetical protein BDN67DRAFT_1072904 [Paxillus ammoniavirescens]|nr:hypothetical protein BDN67DRAFT_1072904 [Paxillus ammoniavirescens]
MEAAHPLFKLAEDSWKLKIFATHSYPSWRATHLDDDCRLLPKGKKVIKDEDDKNSTVSGRKRKGGNSLPKMSGKRFKGKKLEHSATPSPPAPTHVMPNSSELQDQHIDDLVPTPNSLPHHGENIQVLTLPDKEGPARSPSPAPFKFPFKDTPLANDLSTDHSPTSGLVSKDEQPHTNSPEGCESREGEALKKKKFFNPLSTEALEAANFTIPTTSLPRVTMLPVDRVVPPTDPATASKAIGVPKDVDDDSTTQTGEGEGTATKKKMRKYVWRPGTKKDGRTLCALRWLKQTHAGGSGTEFKNYYDKVLNLKQRKNNSDIYHRQEYHDEAQTLISASKWNGDTDVCDGPVH